MSLTVIQRFYELAKEKADATGVGMTFDGSYHELPWWIIKSKAKHFALGLLEKGARRGDNFYLLPSEHPNWIYSEIAALTIGLKTVPLPKNITSDYLDTLVERYPPHFIFLQEAQSHLLDEILQKGKSIKEIIFSVKSGVAPDNSPKKATDFRRIFNLGIVHESKHHQQYRKSRQELNDSDVMSPIWVDHRDRVEFRPLHYSDVNRISANLTQRCHLRKIKGLFVQADLSRTLDRIACLYWSIYLGISAVHYNASGNLLSQLSRTNPTIAFVDKTSFEEAVDEKLPDVPKKTRLISGFLSRIKIKWIFGRRLRLILSVRPLKDSVLKKLSARKVNAMTLQG